MKFQSHRSFRITCNHRKKLTRGDKFLAARYYVKIIVIKSDKLIIIGKAKNRKPTTKNRNPENAKNKPQN
jgi:hypothetical protein